MTPVREPYRVLVEVKVWALDEDEAYSRAFGACSSRRLGVQKPIVKNIEKWEDE